MMSWDSGLDALNYFIYQFFKAHEGFYCVLTVPLQDHYYMQYI